MDIMKISLAMVVERLWNSLPREIVDAPSLETVQLRFDSLEQLDELEGFPAHGLDNILKSPFQPKRFCCKFLTNKCSHHYAWAEFQCLKNKEEIFSLVSILKFIGRLEMLSTGRLVRTQAVQS